MTLIDKKLKIMQICYTLFMDTCICSKSVKTCVGRINTKCKVMVTFEEEGEEGEKGIELGGVHRKFQLYFFFKNL